MFMSQYLTGCPEQKRYLRSITSGMSTIIIKTAQILESCGIQAAVSNHAEGLHWKDDVQ